MHHEIVTTLKARPLEADTTI